MLFGRNTVRNPSRILFAGISASGFSDEPVCQGNCAVGVGQRGNGEMVGTVKDRDPCIAAGGFQRVNKGNGGVGRDDRVGRPDERPNRNGFQRSDLLRQIFHSSRSNAGRPTIRCFMGMPPFLYFSPKPAFPGGKTGNRWLWRD